MLIEGEIQISPAIVVREDAVPASLARELRFCLSELPAASWRLTETKDQPQHRASMVSLRFFQLKTAEKVQRHAGRSTHGGRSLGIKSDGRSVEKTKDDADNASNQARQDNFDGEGRPKAVTQRVREVLEAALAIHPHERMFLNFSKYEEGCFLDSHTDEVSGSLSYRRRQAFVWHLSEDWEEGDGGLFVDEEAEGGPQSFTPRFNTLVTFTVPRRHSVTRVTAARSGRRARFTAYGWVVVPKVARVDGSGLLPLLSGEGQRAVAVLCLRESFGALGEAIAALFSGLPVEAAGMGHVSGLDFGHFCLFAILAGEGAAAAQTVLGVPGEAEAAVAVVARPVPLEGHGDAVSDAARRICVDSEVLRNASELRCFLHAALSDLQLPGG